MLEAAEIGGEEQHVYHLARTLLSYQRQNLFCDTAIVTQNGMVFAHSAILAAICPNMFASLNQKPFSEHQTNVIELSQYSNETVGKMLEFFYTGKLCKSDISELQGICGKLGIILQVADASSLSDECLKKDALVLEAVASDDEDALASLCLEIPIERKEKEIIVKEETITDWTSEGGSYSKTDSAETDLVSSVTRKSCHVKSNDNESCVKKVVSRVSNRRAVVKTESDKVLGLSEYQCDFCKKTFASQRRLNNHKWIHYRTEGGSYQCNACTKTFPKKDALRKHLKTHSLKCKSYVCPICSHKFLFLSRLQNHLNTHTNAKPFMCDVCGRCFNDRDYLNKHKRIHREDRRYLCGTCGKRFVMNNAYKTHLLTHTGEKPFKCDLCCQQFTQRHSLKVHMLLHNDEAPFQCSFCPRRFRRATRLKIHVLTVHTDNAAKPFHCQMCNKGFSTRCYLQQHLATHNRVRQCGACGKSYSGLMVRKKTEQFCSDCIVEHTNKVEQT